MNLLNIKLKDNIIKILNTKDLCHYQISQLGFYGYMKIPNGFQKLSYEVEADILKVINYLNNENVKLTTSRNIQLIIAESNQRKNKIFQLFQQAQALKNGIIDKLEFQKFNSFLKTLPRQLKEHQIKAAFHLYTLKNGANFSVPGSGKTSTVLSVYEKLKQEGNCNIIFVIGPPSCFQPWQNEFEETLGRTPKTIILTGGNKFIRKSEYYKTKNDHYELYLSTFHTILNDYLDIIKFFNQKNINIFLIVDEAHYIKQPAGSWAVALLEISKYAKYKTILTGTPIPKNYKDIFNLFDFLWLKDSPLDEKSKVQIDILSKQKKHDSIKALLNEKIGPLFYRTRKKDLHLMPPTFHQPIVIEMNTYESKIYNFVKARIIELSKDDYFKNEELLIKLWKGRMMRLRQSISYPKLLLSTIGDYEEKFLTNSDLMPIIKNYDKLEVPNKLRTLIKIVIELNKAGKKVLIWSNFIQTLKLIKHHFTAINMNNELIYGKTPIRKNIKNEIRDEKTREDIREAFIDPNSGLDILIANPAACAESISLHKTCFHAIYYDLSYNCAQYLQSLDRIHRVGGSEINMANYHFLQYKNSIDQDIKENLDAKAKRMYDIIDQDYEIYSLDLYSNDKDDEAAYKRLFIESDNIG